MFCGIDRYAEHVIASKFHNKVITDEKTKYTPGGRFYFDSYQIIRDGIGIRDGIHSIKVKKEISLEKYLIYSIFLNEFGNKKYYTTGEFQKKCNKKFNDFLLRKKIKT